MAEAERTRSRLVLWTLDDAIPGLEAATIGAGPGGRTALLNTLYAHASVDDESFLVVADDDLELAVGSLALLLRVAATAGFMLAQPAHLRSSATSYPFGFGRPLNVARSTTFVEIGPLVVVHPRFRSHVFPLPEEFTMGWGLEAVWHELRGEGVRYGVVDAVLVRHTGRIGDAYGARLPDERRRLRAALARAGADDLKELQRVEARWRRWQQEPPWIEA